MGGAETEVGATTRDVLIEAAHFEPVTIARSARRHKLPSEASRRFERGVDPALAAAAAQLAVDLLVEHGGGVADPDVTDVGTPADPVPGHHGRRLPVEDRRASSTSRARSISVLDAIGCSVTRDGHLLTVTPPTWRPDLTTAEDLVEEVARIHGYERIPSVIPTPPGGAGLTHAQRVRRLVADVLAGQGLSEVWSAPFVGADRYAALGLDVDAEVARTVRLANPLSDEQPLMRTRLLATMVDALRRNVARGTRDVGLFELGLVVALDGPQGSAPTEDVGIRPSDETLAAIRAAVPPQPRHVGLLLAGDRVRAGWWGAGRPADVADVVEVARTVGEALGLALEVSADAVAALPPRPLRPRGAGRRHPRRPRRRAAPQGRRGARAAGPHRGRRARPRRAHGGRPRRPCRRARCTPSRWRRATSPSSSTSRCPRMPCSARCATAPVPDLEALTLFDVYRGDQVGEGRKSLAYRLTFRAPDRTLTTDEVSALRDTALRGGGRGRRGGAARVSVPTEVPVDDEGEVAPEPASEDGRGGHLVAVVTGASRGIGRFVANALEDAGYAVERGSSAVAPVTDRAALTAWVDEVVERHGRIDVLVNNAGVIDTEVDLFASDPEQWWHTQEVNVLGAYLMTWLVAPHMLGGGRRADRQPQQRCRPPVRCRRERLQRQQDRPGAGHRLDPPRGVGARHDCAIDFQAGPSEILILSEAGNPAWLAADLIAQAEHDPDARAVLITSRARLARVVAREVDAQMPADGPGASRHPRQRGHHRDAHAGGGGGTGQSHGS